MKFIGGIHTFSFEDNGIRIKLPHYHRSSTGLFSNTTVYLYPRITNENKVHEVIISPFHPLNWANIWKLELNAIDRPGLIKDITTVLRREKVNIFIQESLITNYNQDFTVSLVANFNEYFDKRGVKIENKLSLEDLVHHHEAIKAVFDRVNENVSEEKIEVERFEQIKFLISNAKEIVIKNSEKAANNKANLLDKEILDYYYRVDYRGTKIENKSVLLDNKLLTDLKLKEYARDSKTIQGTLFSDTEDKFILVRFFSNEQLVINLEITHDVTTVGVINEFTEKIHTADKDFNIISCYNRISDDQNTALWYVLIDVTSNPEQIQKLITELREKCRLSSVKQVKVISYSKSVLDKAAKENFKLEESEEQKFLQIKRQSSDEKQLKLLRELSKEKNVSLENLYKDKQEIEFHVDREVKNTINIFVFLIVASLILIITLIFVTKWEYLDPWFSSIPILLSGFAALYSIIKGIDFRVPKNNEETRNKIREQWTIKKGYEITGEDSLDNQIATRKEEIEEYEADIVRLERKYEADISRLESKLLK